jgi:hypothetical protein
LNFNSFKPDAKIAGYLGLRNFVINLGHRMWKIYDDLIAAVPRSSVASSCLAGLSWFLVRSEGTGVAMRPREEGTVPQAGELAGIKTRELAGWIKSWNPYQGRRISNSQ